MTVWTANGRPQRILGWVFLSATACASADAPSPVFGAKDTVLDRGGALSVEALPSARVQIEGEELVVWAETELPGDARLPVAIRAIEAITRGAFLKVLAVKVKSAMMDVSGSGVRARVRWTTEETARAGLHQRVVVDHGWVRVARPDGPILRLIGRVRLSKSALSRLLSTSHELKTQARRILRAVFHQDSPADPLGSGDDEAVLDEP